MTGTSRIAHWARTEWGPLYDTVRAAFVTGRLAAVPLTLAAVCLSALLHTLDTRPWGHPVVQVLGAVHAGDPLWVTLLRTPFSLFVPALDLPMWGGLVQLFVVFGIAEVCLGRRRTLAVAYGATLAGTLYARVGVALGPHRPLGLPGWYGQVVDTGPSAAVVGLGVLVCLRYGAHVTGSLVVAAMVAEVLLKGNLAGREHLAAIGAVLVLSWAVELRELWAEFVAPAGYGSGLPPIQS
ncbi:hypothetical protein OK074_8909 [Actinobacteria bacterium OK074]|nr:hypothetical protein OK074_8909 [Actinobacteria bacterium OK074]